MKSQTVKFSISLSILFILLGSVPCFSASQKPQCDWSKHLDHDINAIATSRSGNLIAASDIQGNLYVYDNQGKLKLQFRYNGVLSHNRVFPKNIPKSMIYAIVFSPDERYLVMSLGVLNLGTVSGSLPVEDKKYSPSEIKISDLLYPSQKIICLSLKGEILWTFDAQGIPNVSADSQFVVVTPVFDDDSALDSVYVLRKDGKQILKMSNKEDAGLQLTSDARFLMTTQKIINFDGKEVAHALQGQKFVKANGDYLISFNYKQNSGMLERPETVAIVNFVSNHTVYEFPVGTDVPSLDISTGALAILSGRKIEIHGLPTAGIVDLVSPVIMGRENRLFIGDKFVAIMASSAGVSKRFCLYRFTGDLVERIDLNMHGDEYRNIQFSDNFKVIVISSPTAQNVFEVYRLKGY